MAKIQLKSDNITPFGLGNRIKIEHFEKCVMCMEILERNELPVFLRADDGVIFFVVLRQKHLHNSLIFGYFIKKNTCKLSNQRELLYPLFLEMSKILKTIWMCVNRCVLKKKHVWVDKNAFFNQKTSFGGYNRIGFGSWVSSSEIGRYTYVGSNSNLSNAIIGSFCSIASNVSIETATHPTSGYISTSPVFFSLLKQCGATFAEKQYFNEHKTIEGWSCIIGNDVWICDNVKIVGGVRIGDGAIVAMGAVVTKDVPPYAIVGGVPAKVIRYRFSEEEIGKLLAQKWWNKPDKWLKQHVEDFNDSRDYFNLEEVKGL